MRKASKLKGKEKHEKRKKEKIFNFLKNHAIIYNLLIILEKYLIRNLELWEIIIENDGYVDEKQIMNVKTFLSKIKVIQKSEDIVIFCKGKTIYNPQKYKGSKNHSVGDKNTGIVVDKNNYGKFVQLDRKDILGDMKFPRSILNFQRIKSEQLHPTQKPVELLNYLIRTYSNVGDLVLDFTAGVMSTGVACIETSRKFIGIELNENYFNLGKERLEFEINRKVQKSLF